MLTWRTGSIWPAVVCHTTNNLMGILGARFGDPDATMELRLSTFDAVMLAIVAIAFVGAVVILVRCGKPQTDN